MKLNHIAIIVSSEENIYFYKKLGFVDISREQRETDVLIYMENDGVVLEIYVDKTHPQRVTGPEALGLRHLGFEVESLENIDVEWIKEDAKGRFTFMYDPDGLPIEIREKR